MTAAQDITLPAMPNFSLEGRRALVSGASRGIGRASAAVLANAGAQVTMLARNKDELDAVARAIGPKANAVALDVSDLAQVDAFFEEQQAFDILVNCAGTNRPKPMLDVTLDDYDTVIGLNVRSCYFLAQAVVRGMVDAGIKGSLIHIGSQMGHVGAANRSLYCASKWALEGMSKALAVELAPQGIRSNTIAPTFIETPMTKPFFEDAAFKAEVLGKIKLGRIGQVEDVLGALIYLASDASDLVTGTSMLVDGGWTAE